MRARDARPLRHELGTARAHSPLVTSNWEASGPMNPLAWPVILPPATLVLAQLFDNASAGQHGMRPAGAVGVVDGDVDAEVAVHRSEHVLRRLGIGAREGAVPIGFADHAAALDWAARERGA